MLRSNSKSLGNHVVSPEEEKRNAAVGRICRKGRFKPGMIEWVGDGKLIIISMTVSGVNVYKSPQIFPLITAPAGGRCSSYRARIDKSLSGIPRSRTGRRRRPCWRRSSISGVRRMRGSTGSARRRRSCAWTGSRTVPPPACHFARNVPSRIWPRPCRTDRRSRISCWSRRILPPAAGLKRTTSAASRNFVNSGLWVLSVCVWHYTDDDAR